MNVRKRTSLDAVFGGDHLPAASPPKKAKERTKAEEPAQAGTLDVRPPERAGDSKRPNVKQHTAYLPLAVHEQLRRLAFEENRKIHDYLVEGLDRVFADRGLPAAKDLG
jgi:hypothetical protein